MIAEQLLPTPTLDSQQLELQLQRALQATIFTSNLRIAPRRINQIAREITSAFSQFLAARHDSAPIYAYGQRLASEGIGHRTILALVETLHQASWEQAQFDNAELPASIPCSSQLLAGYMAGREAYLLQEQERTRVALDRAREHAKLELA